MYDILSDLAPKWNDLSKNEQAYYLNQQAGANQTQNLAAILENFKTVTKATGTAMNDSLGSAIEENEAYMQSLEAQTNNLKATFQDLSNRVISKDLISAFLNLANNALGLVDNKVGATIIQFGLLTTTLIGVAGTAKEFLPAFIAGFTGIGSEAAVAAGGVKGFLAILGGFAPYAAIIAGIAVAIGLVGKAVYDWYDDTHKSIDEYNELIDSADEKLKTNRDRLNEINSMPWSQKTADILAEKAAIEEENKELQDLIDKYNELKKKAAERTLKAGGLTTVQKWSVTGASEDSEVLGWATGRANALYDTLQDIVDALPAAQAGTEATEEALKGLGLQFEKVDTQVRLFGDEYENNLIKRANELSVAIQNNQGDSENLRAEYDEVVDKLGELADAHDVLDDKQTAARDTLNSLNEVYEYYSYIAEKAVGQTDLTKQQVTALTNKYPQLASAIDVVNGKNYLNVDSLAAVTGATEDEIREIYNAVAATTVFNNNNIDPAQKLTALKQIAAAAGVAQEMLAGVHNTEMGFNRNVAFVKSLGYSEEEAQQRVLSAMWNKWMGSVDFSTKTTKGTPSTYTPTTTSPTSSASKKASNEAAKSQKKEKTAVELSTEAWKEQLSLLKDKLELLEKSGATDQEQIDQMKKIQQAIHEQADKYRALNLKNDNELVRQLGILWWDYANDISDLQDKMAKEQEERDKEAEEKEKERLEEAKSRAEELYETEKQLWEERLNKQKSDYEIAVNVVLKKIDEEIDKLNSQRDEIEKFYDDQIQALQDTNDELDRQIQKEELLENLAKAQDKTLYVFKDGRFQYLQDTEAVAEAQAQLDAYEREEALRKETENLNKQKDNALKAIDEQIEGWNKYREQWEKVTTDYQEQQDKLIAEQVLGIDLEQKNWETRLGNVQDFVNKYNDILSQLDAGYPKSLEDYYKDAGLNGDGTAWSGGGGSDGGYDSGVGPGASMRDDGRVDYSDDSPGKDMDKDRDGYVDSDWLEDNGAPDWVSNAAAARGHANGTLSAEPGLSLVGERGPELKVLGGGEGIIPADVTRNLWNWGKINPSAFAQSMNNVFNIDNLSLPNATNAETLISGLRQMAYQRAYQRA